MAAPALQESTREATSSDLDRLVEMAAAAIEELRGERGGAVWARHLGRQAPLRDGLAADLAAGDRRVLVGALDDVVVAYAVARTEPLHDGTVLGVVHDIYVEPDARAVGLGELLLDDLVSWCRAEGCIGIDALALPGMRETKNFFETAHMVARAIVVHRSFEEPADG